MKTMIVEKRGTDSVGEIVWTKQFSEGDRLDDFINDTVNDYIFEESVLFALVDWIPGSYVVEDAEFNYYIEITEAIVC